MSSAHGAFQALGPVTWESFAQQDAQALMTEIFEDARCLISSIPIPTKTESHDVDQPSTDPRAAELRKDWKEVKVNARENPLGLNIYKLGSKDGKGSWFARRSYHEGHSFKKWKAGMEREFAESLKVQGPPGEGKIRGLGADKCVVDQTVEKCGKMQVYHLSAQFPGPTSPRDFVTLCLSSDKAALTHGSERAGAPRSYMLVSKPCVHPECAERPGFIRGCYESVEIIREISVGGSDAADAKSADASSSITNGPNGALPPSYSQSNELEGNKDEENESVIEWTMITRSDPGGSVPRFMIEKKTPDGIATDANKFVQWVSSAHFETLLNANFEPAKVVTDTPGAVVLESGVTHTPSTIEKTPTNSHTKAALDGTGQNPPESPGPGGVYGMISGTLGMVASAAASRLLGPREEEDSDSDLSSSELSDKLSSIHSFHSLDDAEDDEPVATLAEDKESVPSLNKGGAGADSVHSTESASASASASTPATAASRHEKELRKLEERRRKAEEKIQRSKERALAKRNDEAQRDELALQKLREKHEREAAKQEEKYRREREKLEARRASEEKKAEERRRKQAERDQKASLTLELERARAERDVARKEIDILTNQVGQLQALNTRLVARLGREGISLDDGTETTARSRSVSELGGGVGR